MKHPLPVFFIAITIACLVNVAIAAPPLPNELSNIRFATPTGAVTFKHRQHADLSFVKCETCHHEYQGGDAIDGCHVCHKADKQGNLPAVRDALHLKCAGCHEYTVQSGVLDHAGPTKTQCKLCHIK
ncbi:MAG: cytochrome c3 family protein [Thiotrichales bacterium]